MWWLVGCGWVVPTEVTGGTATPCAAIVDRIDAARPIADVTTLAASPRRSDTRRAEVRAWIADQWRAAGLTPREVPFSLDKIDGVNLVAGEGRILVGAHYDSVAVTPGADDNASGVAVMLEVARVLGPAATYVAFDAEEPFPASVGTDGRNFAIGSQAFVDATPGAWDLAVIIESVGYTCADCQQAPPGVPAAMRDSRAIYAVLGGERAWGDDIATFGAASGPLRVVGVNIPNRGAGLRQSRFSDHAPFWDVDVPAVMITDTALLRNPHYHERSDTAETLDPAMLAGVARGVAAMVGAATGRCG